MTKTDTVTCVLCGEFLQIYIYCRIPSIFLNSDSYSHNALAVYVSFILTVALHF